MSTSTTPIKPTHEPEQIYCEIPLPDASVALNQASRSLTIRVGARVFGVKLMPATYESIRREMERK